MFSTKDITEKVTSALEIQFLEKLTALRQIFEARISALERRTTLAMQSTPPTTTRAPKRFYVFIHKQVHKRYKRHEICAKDIAEAKKYGAMFEQTTRRWYFYSEACQKWFHRYEVSPLKPS